MKGLGEFFSKIQNKFSREVFLRTQIREVIKKHTNIDISLDAMAFKGTRIVFNKLSSIEKSQILIKKTMILRDLGEKLPERKIEDVC